MLNTFLYFSVLIVSGLGRNQNAKILRIYLCLWSSSCQSTLEMLAVMSFLTRFFDSYMMKNVQISSHALGTVSEQAAQPDISCDLNNCFTM